MADGDEDAGVKDFARKLKGLDTSQVEVDDEQAPPAFAADSPEEAARLAELEAEIARSGVAARWQAFSAASGYGELPLWCLRGRKYDVARAAELLPRLMDLIEELEIGGGDQERIMSDLQTLKFVALGTKDAHGRAILWLRMRFHDPKVSKPRDMVSVSPMPPEAVPRSLGACVCVLARGVAAGSGACTGDSPAEDGCGFVRIHIHLHTYTETRSRRRPAHRRDFSPPSSSICCATPTCSAWAWRWSAMRGALVSVILTPGSRR